VNWYLNDFTRVMFNWVHENADTGSAGDATADILQFRLQVEF
jgi:phosphate-selective porin